MSSSTGFTNGIANARFYRIGSERLGIKYDSGTFSVIHANGLDLSSTNAAYVTLPSKANPGQFTTYDVTANQSFIDGTGSSEIVGNKFGFVSAVAIAVDVPFFLYAVTNDAEDGVTFMISRHPHRNISPSAADIGAPDDVAALKEGDFFSLENIDETLYESNPCICVGSFRMQMTTTGWEWAVQSLVNTDGIDQYQEQTVFIQPKAQFAANNNSYSVPTGGVGTLPVFSTNEGEYYITRDGYVNYNLFLSGDGGTDGTQAEDVLITVPFNGNITSVNVHGVGTASWAGGNTFDISFRLSTLNTALLIQDNLSPSGRVQWSVFTAGTRNITATIYYKLGTT
jgi:hypothetical protein